MFSIPFPVGGFKLVFFSQGMSIWLPQEHLPYRKSDVDLIAPMLPVLCLTKAHARVYHWNLLSLQKMSRVFFPDLSWLIQTDGCTRVQCQCQYSCAREHRSLLSPLSGNVRCSQCQTERGKILYVASHITHSEASAAVQNAQA